MEIGSLVIAGFVIFLVGILVGFTFTKIDNYKPIGSLVINKDVNDFYLTKLIFDDSIESFESEEYVLLKIDKDTNLYEQI